MVKYEMPEIKIVPFVDDDVYCIVRVSGDTDMMDDIFNDEFKATAGGVI